MSVGYKSVQWNAFKRRYDLVLGACVLAYLAMFLAIGRIAFFNQFRQVFQLIHQSSRLARRVRSQSIHRQDRQEHGRIDIARHCVGQHLRINLAPGHRFLRRGAGQATRVGASVGHLEEVIMTGFFQTEDFLNLWFGLQHEVLGRAAAENEHAAAAPGFLCLIDDGCRLIDIA